MIGAFGGLGGVATYLRFIGQNKTDDRRQLTQEQTAFRQAMAAEIAALRQQTRNLEADKDKLEARMNETAQTAARLIERSEKQEQQIAQQATQIAAQDRQIAQQSEQIAALTDERQQYIERLAVVEAQRTYLESECNVLRRENERLRGQLPARVEVSNATS